MKQTLFLLLFTISLLGNDFVEDFFTQQIEIVKQMEDQNLSTEALEKYIEEEDELFKDFFAVYLSSEKKESSLHPNPYRSEVFKIKRRVSANKQRDNSYAVMRDELKLSTLALKQNFRNTMYQVNQATNLKTYKAFDKRLHEIIIQRHEKESILDLNKYIFAEKILNPDLLIESVQANLDEYRYIQSIHNNFSAELIQNSHDIYKVGVITGYGILSMAMKIRDSSIGQVIDPYLQYLYLSSAKLVFIIIVLLFVSLLYRAITFALRRLLHLVSKSEDDVSYIIGKTSGPFRLFAVILTTELVFTVYSGLKDIPTMDTVYDIVYVFLTSFFIYRLGNAIAVIKMEEMQRNKFVKNEVINLGLKMMNGLVGLVALIFILKMLNVNLTAILSGLGIGGVAVAFAAKDTLANFFGSISILLSDLFEQGDWIAVDDMEGTVVEIGLRATTVRTFDNALIAIPNFKLADNGIKNWSRRTMGRRIKMKIGVTYESEMENVKKAIVEIREMLQNHPGIATEKTEYMSSERQMKLVSKEDLKGIKRMIMVYLDEFGNSSIDILVYCFSRAVVWNEWHEVKEDVMFKIADILKANNLEFAYPTMMIHQADAHPEA